MNFQSIPENRHYSIIFSEGYKVQRIQTNPWLVIISESFHVTINCASSDAKILCPKKTQLVEYKHSLVQFSIGFTKVQAELKKFEIISDPVLIRSDCCETFLRKIITPQVKSLNVDIHNMEDLDNVNHKLDHYSRDLPRNVGTS